MNQEGVTQDQPIFAQPEATADPSTFKIKHPSDNAAYKVIDQLNKEKKINPLPFPPPRGGVEPILTLQEVFGGNAGPTNKITNNGQIVFHATGDCGSTVGPKTQNEVADKMVADFNEADPKEVPQFNFLLGDVVYSFGETQYYYDQFYEPYREYPAPILAVAGNHDGMVSPLAEGVDSLEGFLRNFCSETFTVTPEAGGLSRTAQIQPGVFYTFDAPYVRILALYSNTLEDPGVIADGGIYSGLGTTQLDYLAAALARCKKENYKGCLLIASHHPAYTAGSNHGWSQQMTSQVDAACTKAGFWPHAVLAGHAHNYQRFTRHRKDGTLIPYIICGNGGHNAQALTRGNTPPPRTPQVIQAAGAGKDQVVLENYDAAPGHYGYLRVIVDDSQLRIEYHPAGDGAGAKTPDDYVTVDLKTRMATHYTANDLGAPAAAKAISQKVKKPQRQLAVRSSQTAGKQQTTGKRARKR